MASFALENLVYARQKQNSEGKDMCEIGEEEFTCWQKSGGRQAFVSWERLDENHRDFRDSVTSRRMKSMRIPDVVVTPGRYGGEHIGRTVAKYGKVY